MNWTGRLCWRLRLCSVLLALLRLASAKPRQPVLKWGQRPDRLYLTFLVPEVKSPEITIEEKKVFFRAHSRGQDYELNIPLLRPINTTASKKEINDWSINLELVKDRKEPCWKKLSKANIKSLKKDLDKWYVDECQHSKELWREAYFTAKLKGKDPSKGKEEAEKADKGEDKEKDDPKAAEKEKWEKQIKEYRAKAIPRTKKPKEKKKKR